MSKRLFELGSIFFVIGFVVSVWANRSGGGMIDSLDDDLRVRTPATARQIDSALNAIGAYDMVGLGSAFKQAERESGVNALFLTALAMHESNLGTSRIAREKNNLFGWGAYDDTPFESAYSFYSREAGIRYVASRIRAMYFNEWGLTTLRGMNTRYASDTNWGNAVLNWIRRLQSEIFD